MSCYCFINGQILPVDKATIHISDLGFLRSYAVFDFLRTYNGKPFRLKDHSARFSNSARELRLTLKYSEEEIKHIIEELLSKSKLKEAGIRLLLTGGYSPDSMNITEPNFLIILEELSEPGPEIYKKGVKLITYQYQRDIPAVKSTLYLNAIKLQPLMKKQNAFDLLYCYKDEVLENPRNNFFIFKRDTLITPKENVLLGITRKVVLELAEGFFNIEERKVYVSELKVSDEAFLCGTSKRIIPVVQVDDYKIKEGKVGENTLRMMQLFDEYIQLENKN
ncbi:MAG TPA: aminotransferase IV [bacterium]|nr:aminotransferase IV [bacterium]